MSTITNYDYLLRNYYSSNRLARKSYNRVNMKSSELASADSAAICQRMLIKILPCQSIGND